MVEQIATEVDGDAADLLRSDVASLGRRLESVGETIAALADIAEVQAANRAECERNVAQARGYLSGMQEVSDVRERRPATRRKLVH